MYTNLYLLTIKIIMIMKRFFIFAALLLAHVSNATATHEDPPPVIPSTDRIVLVPQDMFDIDRSVPYCCYTYYPGTGVIHIHCEGTGKETGIYLMNNGNIIDSTVIDSDIVNDTYLTLTEQSDSYIIVINSEKYYGEAVFETR